VTHATCHQEDCDIEAESKIETARGQDRAAQAEAGARRGAAGIAHSSGNLVGQEPVTLKVDGKKMKLRALHAMGPKDDDASDLRLWVLDHPTWPIICKTDFSDDCGAELVEIVTSAS
jgi:hypothetical protein